MTVEQAVVYCPPHTPILLLDRDQVRAPWSLGPLKHSLIQPGLDLCLQLLPRGWIQIYEPLSNQLSTWLQLQIQLNLICTAWGAIAKNVLVGI